ncbi:hypothetical protein Acsp03_37150 [Actinomadura sp. NBRC 104412]|nr:hypothetical protein Acsp03_37150 [Actinomadura sp. NBRC 104412]
MARRKARFTPQELAVDPRLRDHSRELWREKLDTVQPRAQARAPNGTTGRRRRVAPTT